MDPITMIMLVLPAIAGVLFLLAFMSFFKIWLKAHLAETPVSLTKIVGMRLRQVNPAVIVDSYIFAKKAEVSVSIDQLETHHLAQGDVQGVVQAMAMARKAGIPLTFQDASANDFAGHDPRTVIKDAMQRWELAFDRIAPDSDTPIEGNCGDGSRVGASVKVLYRQPTRLGQPNHFPLQAEMAVRVLSFINDAQGLAELEGNARGHEAALLEFGRGQFNTLDSVELTYYQA